jgi:hypothetical protein
MKTSLAAILLAILLSPAVAQECKKPTWRCECAPRNQPADAPAEQ